MAVTIEELEKSRKRSLKSSEREYRIDGATTENEALAGLLADAPAALNGQTLDKTNCSVEEFGQGIFLGTAQYISPEYESPNTPVTNSFTISFDIATQSQTLRQSFSTRHKYTASGKTARDFKGAINVDMDGNVNGVEIQTPVLGFTLNYSVPPSLINDAYIDLLSNIVGKTNADIFKTKPIGSLLLTRVSGQKRDAENWDINFTFGYQRGVTNFTIGTITGIEKYGWEYLWVFYEMTTETVGGVKITKPVATNVYVEQVYQMTAYSALGLPS